MVKHIVLFKLKESLTAEAKSEVANCFKNATKHCQLPFRLYAKYL